LPCVICYFRLLPPLTILSPLFPYTTLFRSPGRPGPALPIRQERVMRLHSITLVDYRGITNASVDFGSGVTTVEGPNEIGKSSIHQACTQLRPDMAGSRKASVKDTQPVGSDVGPQVELHLSTGEYEVRYRKRWLRQPFTELNILKPVPEQISGDEAHERFLSILDDTVDVDLLDALD